MIGDHTTCAVSITPTPGVIVIERGRSAAPIEALTLADSNQ